MWVTPVTSSASIEKRISGSQASHRVLSSTSPAPGSGTGRFLDGVILGPGNAFGVGLEDDLLHPFSRTVTAVMPR